MVQLLAAPAVVAQKDKRMLAAYLFMAELHQSEGKVSKNQLSHLYAISGLDFFDSRTGLGQQHTHGRCGQGDLDSRIG
jgi:hypothetical protein